MGRYSGALHGFGAPEGALFQAIFPRAVFLSCPVSLY